MATLHLTVDCVDNEAENNAIIARAEAEKKKNAKRGSWLESIWKKKEEPAPHVFTLKGGTDYSPAKVANILRDFLRPDCKRSHADVAVSILELIPDNAENSSEVGGFGEICAELAEQIPYNHPAQLRFAMLLGKLGQSPKFRYIYNMENSKEIIQKPFQLLWESITDTTGPYEDCPHEWVNINSFLANLFAAGIWGVSPGRSFLLMRHVFETKRHNQEAWERNSEIMAVSQWILWHGQTMFKFIIYDDDSATTLCNVGNDIGDWPAFAPRSVERWRFWQANFASVADMTEATDECKQLAGRAARLMNALEETMLFRS